jgi:hydroxybutyrate-dimer hydrolase
MVFIIVLSSPALSHYPINKKPKFIKGKILMQEYDGITNDLLTGGLGLSGIEFGAPAPVFADPDNPTAEELRTLAIQTNYRAVLDPSPGGGWGLLYGPNIDPEGNPTLGEGLVAGKEYLAYSDNGTGKKNVTLMVQIPDTFDPENPCIITAPSSGSRGVYGAIGTSGEWGLKRGCVVCYSDGGKGTGVHDLATDTVNLIDGTRQEAAVAGKKSHFTAIDDPAKLAAFNAEYPDRIAVKHAHSRQNPEVDWGKNVLQSIEFAFYVLNLEENFGKPHRKGWVRQTITPKNTIVIASSISNGGTASVRAAEQDKKGLIDGIAVSEPNLSPRVLKKLVIRQGDRQWTADSHSKLLYDYFSFINVYQTCADLAQPDASLNTGVVFPDLAENRCASLAEIGLLTEFKADSVTETTAEERALEAQQIINDYGILEEQNWVQPTQEFFEFNEAITVTYANAAGRFGVTDNLCGNSFAGVDALLAPAPLPSDQLAQLFGVFNGVPPSSGVQLINNDSDDGAVRNRFSVTDDVQNQNLRAALCYRLLFTGRDEFGHRLRGRKFINHIRVRLGLSRLRYSGRLRGIPAVIVHGRNDGVVPPNHSSRAYYGVNQIVESKRSNLHYYEVTNANHLDAFIPFFTGYQERFIPLHYYFDQAVSIMYDHLKNGTPLPPSQVVRTIPREVLDPGGPPVIADITEDNVPPILENPDDADRITIKKRRWKVILNIPE